MSSNMSSLACVACPRSPEALPAAGSALPPTPTASSWLGPFKCTGAGRQEACCPGASHRCPPPSLRQRVGWAAGRVCWVGVLGATQVANQAAQSKRPHGEGAITPGGRAGSTAGVCPTEADGLSGRAPCHLRTEAPGSTLSGRADRSLVLSGACVCCPLCSGCVCLWLDQLLGGPVLLYQLCWPRPS